MPRRPAPLETLDEVLAALGEAGKENTAKIYRRHGAEGEVLGVPYKDMDRLAKRAAPSLAEALWDSGIHEARVLAAKIVDPDAPGPRVLGRWLRTATDRAQIGVLGGLVSRRRDGVELALRWIDRKGEWPRATGWVALTGLANAGRLDEDLAGELLERIRTELPGAFNRERYNMNNALIAIGGTYRALHPRAEEVARALGKVEVDHGETGCKTPDALPYMKKMWERREARSARR